MCKKIFLLIASIIFYLYLDAKYFLLLLFEIIVSYLIAKLLEKKKSKAYLISGIAVVVFILAFFKYSGFIIRKTSLSLNILMPIGISYYSFKIISYLIDTYKNTIDYKVSFLDYFIYVSFFPEILSGPISRPKEIIEQLNKTNTITKEKIVRGIELILDGLFKKYVIANRIANYTSLVFGAYGSYPSFALWLSMFLFSIQLYCDFDGYSKIAIGVSKIIGFDINDNFKTPYFSYNIKQFWKRWHISLSSWLKDYIYIPLGGNKCSKLRNKINVLITFVISGIWHGNTINYLIWGIYHGIANILSFKKPKNKLDNFFKTLGTFIIVSFGWVIFSIQDLNSIVSYIAKMFTEFSLSYNNIVLSIFPFTNDYSCSAYFLCICIFILILFIFEFNDQNNKAKIPVRIVIYILSIALFGKFGTSSFLYANF